MSTSRHALAAAVLALASCRQNPAEPLELASARGVRFDIREKRPPTGYDPLALATASIGRVANVEAPVPPVCYTRTDGTSNPCWACHTRSSFPNLAILEATIASDPRQSDQELVRVIEPIDEREVGPSSHGE